MSVTAQVRHPLGDICSNYFLRLVRTVRFSGWGRSLSDDEVEDAVACAFLAALSRPEPFEQALASDDTDWILRRLHLIAKRKAKDFERRAWRRSELGGEHLPTDGRCEAPPVEQMLDLNARLEPLIEEAVALVCRSRAVDLIPAIQESLLGDTDAAAARRHGVTRESVNRCRRYVQQRLREA